MQASQIETRNTEMRNNCVRDAFRDLRRESTSTTHFTIAAGLPISNTWNLSGMYYKIGFCGILCC